MKEKKLTPQEVGKLFHRKKIFETPEDLEAAFSEYGEYCIKNPIEKQESIKSGPNAGKTFPVKVPRIMTLRGFALFIGHTERTLLNYGTKLEYKEYHETHEKIKDIIDEHQLQHGVVGNFNERIIMSKQGMKDKKELSGSINLRFDKDDARV